MKSQHIKHICRLLRDAAEKAPGKASFHDPATYLGTTRELLGIAVPQRRSIMKAWIGEHREMPAEAVLDLAEALLQCPACEENAAARDLLDGFPKARAALSLERFEAWLAPLVGWAEIDTLCQSTFSAAEVLLKWSSWDALLERLAGSAEVAKRRASLVLLTGPVRESGDRSLAERALSNLSVLHACRDPLISKAVSWLLRSMIGHFRQDVEVFIRRFEAELPRFVIREVRTKLTTGRKT